MHRATLAAISAAILSVATVDAASAQARLFPRIGQTNMPSDPFTLLDPWGQDITASTCGGTQSQCAQEVTNAVYARSWELDFTTSGTTLVLNMPWTFPAGRSVKIRGHQCGVATTNLGSADTLLVHAQEASEIHLDCVWQQGAGSTGALVRLKPFSVDLASMAASRLSFGNLWTNPGGTSFVYDTSQVGIQGIEVAAIDINGGAVGVGCNLANILQGVTTRILNMHSQTTSAVSCLGSPGIDTHNRWVLPLVGMAGGTAAIDTFSIDDDYRATILTSGPLGYGIRFNAGSCNNAHKIFAGAGVVQAVMDTSACNP